MTMKSCKNSCKATKRSLPLIAFKSSIWCKARTCNPFRIKVIFRLQPVSKGLGICNILIYIKLINQSTTIQLSHSMERQTWCKGSMAPSIRMYIRLLRKKCLSSRNRLLIQWCRLLLLQLWTNLYPQILFLHKKYRTLSNSVLLSNVPISFQIFMNWEPRKSRSIWTA